MISMITIFESIIPFEIEDPKILLSLIFGFVLFVAFEWFVPPIWPLGVRALRASLTERQTRIAEDQAQVQRALADTQQLRNDYAGRIQRIEAEQRERIEAAVREAETARAEIIAEAQSSANALRRRSEEEIAREQTRTRIEMRRQIVAITLDAAEQAARANSGEQVQHQLIRDFIVGAAKNGHGASNGNGAPAFTSVAPSVTPTSAFSEAAPVSSAPDVERPTSTAYSAPPPMLALKTPAAQPANAAPVADITPPLATPPADNKAPEADVVPQVNPAPGHVGIETEPEPTAPTKLAEADTPDTNPLGIPGVPNATPGPTAADVTTNNAPNANPVTQDATRDNSGFVDFGSNQNQSQTQGEA